MNRPRTNEELQSHYEKLHAQGSAAWFSDGREERQAIIEAGKPWTGLCVLEIGCGEGELSSQINALGAMANGIDYSRVAIQKARDAHPEVMFNATQYRDIKGTYFHRIVMQGVLEHLNDPWTELRWMIDNLLAPGGDIITSSPCFLNPRGIVWMTLVTLFDAPMSLTDLHFLHPWEFEEFADKAGFSCSVTYCDQDWGNGRGMMEDYRDRLPKVFPEFDAHRIVRLCAWLNKAKGMMKGVGATAVYHLRRK